jgi:hypothetical protein
MPRFSKFPELWQAFMAKAKYWKAKIGRWACPVYICLALIGADILSKATNTFYRTSRVIVNEIAAHSYTKPSPFANPSQHLVEPARRTSSSASNRVDLWRLQTQTRPYLACVFILSLTLYFFVCCYALLLYRRSSRFRQQFRPHFVDEFESIAKSHHASAIRTQGF